MVMKQIFLGQGKSMNPKNGGLGMERPSQTFSQTFFFFFFFAIEVLKGLDMGYWASLSAPFIGLCSRSV